MPHPRYRFENDQHVIDVRIGSIEQLFDNRDPAPFRERDLDPDLVDYLMDAAEDLAKYGSFRIVLWCAADRAKAENVEAAFRAHFDYELGRLARERRRRHGVGVLALLMGAVLLVILQLLARAFAHAVEGSSVADAIHEGLVIFSWVVLWRPVEVFVYDWIPGRRQRRLMKRLHDAPIELRAA